MTGGPRKPFGRRGVVAPPVVTGAPQGFLDAPRALSPARKRSLAIALVALGAGSLGGYAAYEAAPRRDCPREGEPSQEDCRRSTGGGHGGSGRGWLFGGWGARDSSPSASAHEGGASGLRAFFGGFGRMGLGHGGGS